ncbi:uncharacterized protein LOC131440216 [Malaya genurostris]|uniref:uncharacterized protein LOC131440216 n=1 Tax=Malaya genurostris TaxID=325434 RepID=UPI0026F3C194|nr:uncharacterized protein LOC131440216 [Malaya genurostris]
MSGKSNVDAAGGGDSGLYIYVGNIQKAATEDQLRQFFRDCKGIVSVYFRLEQSTYCPTKIAFVKFADRQEVKKAFGLNNTFFQGKRVFIASVDSERNFTPRYSVMVKHLNEYITEEDVYDHFKNIGTIECVQKPANNYAYISFERSESAQRALRMKDRSLKGVDIEMDTIKRTICMLLEKPKGLLFSSIQDKCDALGLKYEPAAEEETKLLVTNIPRQVPEKDIVEYLGKFGRIMDWEMQKSPIAVLTNIGYVTYMNPATARHVYLYGPHYFQGVGLDIYNPRITYGETKSSTAVLLKRTNVYLTNDEIFQAMNECGRVNYIHRVDASRYSTIVRFQFYIALSQALKVKQIADENVYITKYTQQSYLTDIAPIPEAMPKGSIRISKEVALRKIIDEEDRVEFARFRMLPNANYLNPNPEFYRNEVLIMNYAVGLGLSQFREYFRKFGNVINFRERTEGFIRTGYLSFETRLEARRACSLNQNFINGTRVLVHLANECLFIDPESCILVNGLNANICDEDIYDQFNEVGNVKFVLRKAADRAIVCMEHKRKLEPALRVQSIGRCHVQTERIKMSNAGRAQQPQQTVASTRPNLVQIGSESNAPQNNSRIVGQRDSMAAPGTVEPMRGPGGPMMNPNGNMMGRSGPNGPMMGPNGPMGPMAGPNGPMMGPNGPMMGPNGPMMGPNGPMRGPNGPMMGPNGSMMGPNGPNGPMIGPSGPRGGPMGGPHSPMMGPNGPMMGPNGPMMGPNGPMMGPNGPMMGHNGPMMGPNGPMMGPNGPMMGPGGPMMGPNGPMMGPGGPMMGPGGPMMGPNQDAQTAPVVTPAMRRLMQIVEGEMINVRAFSTLPMIEQFHLIHGIVNQFINYPQFLNMKPDKKISFLITGQNGFVYADLFTLFTYPQQLKLLSMIHSDYVNTITAESSDMGPKSMSASNSITYSKPIAPNNSEDNGALAPWQIKSTSTSSEAMKSDAGSKKSKLQSAQNRFEEAEKLKRKAGVESNQDDDKVETMTVSSESSVIPPAPDPPEFSTKKSRSISPTPSPVRIGRMLSKSPIPRYRNPRSSSISPSRRVDHRSSALKVQSSSGRRDSLSPLSSALLPSLLLRYNRSRSRSPRRYREERDRYETSTRARYRTRSRSPNLSRRSRYVTSPSPRDRDYQRQRSRSAERRRVHHARSRSPQLRGYSRTPSLSPSPPPRIVSPAWDERNRSPLLEERIHREQYAEVNEEHGVSSCIFVGNLPLDTTEDNIAEIFGKFGQIVKLKLPTFNIGTKRAFITFDTFDQAVRALDMHLRLYRGHLLRVAFNNKKQKERPGFAVNVSVNGQYDEVAIYDTFKMCGEITYIWTRIYHSKSFCVIDFKHRDAVRAAVGTHKLLNGHKCKVCTIV